MMYGWSRKEKAYGSVRRNRDRSTTVVASMNLEGMGLSIALVEGTTDSQVFEAYVERVLAPTLCEGQVAVIDNPSLPTKGRGF